MLYRLGLAAIAAFIFSTASHAQEGQTIQVGAIYSLTGYGADDGQGELNANRLAIEEINSAGGILGHRIVLHAEDNQSQLKTNVVAFKKLQSANGIQFLLGPNFAEFSDLVAPLAESAGIPMITASGYSRTLTKDKDNVFTMMPAHSEAVRPLFQHIRSLKPKKVALLSSNNTYTESIAQSFQELMADNGNPIWKQFSFDPMEQDYRATISRLKSSEVDCVVAFLLQGGGSADFLRQARELKLPTSKIFFGPSLPYDQAVLDNIELAEGVVLFDYPDPSNHSFQTRYRERFKREPSWGSGKAYDAVYALKAAIESCGNLNNTAKCLRNTSFRGVTGEVRFQPDGNFAGNQKVTRLFQVRNGKFEAFS